MVFPSLVMIFQTFSTCLNLFLLLSLPFLPWQHPSLLLFSLAIFHWPFLWQLLIYCTFYSSVLEPFLQLPNLKMG